MAVDALHEEEDRGTPKKAIYGLTPTQHVFERNFI
jgi:hypothetical protein